MKEIKLVLKVLRRTKQITKANRNLGYRHLNLEKLKKGLKCKTYLILYTTQFKI